MPEMDLSLPYQRLDHGFDESKEHPDRTDLKQAAEFRGGQLVSRDWNGDLDQKLEWRCCRDHRFELTPRTVLLGGHWCRKCIDPPWDYEEIAGKNRFAAQVLQQDS
jgi:hypothetical protein